MSQETTTRPIYKLIPDIIDDTKKRDVKLLAEQTMNRAGNQRRRRIRIRACDPNHIPRPVNCFMQYRLEMQKYIREHCPYANHREISKVVAKWWHEETSEIKEVFRAAADKAKLEHRNKYPGYKYSPKKKKQRQQKEQEMMPRFDQEHSIVERLAPFDHMASVPWQHQDSAFYMPQSQYYMLSPDPTLPSSHLPPLDNPLTSTSNTPVWDPQPLGHDDYNLDLSSGISRMNKCTCPSSSSSSSSSSPDMWNINNNHPLSSSSLPSCDLEAYAASNMQSILDHDPIIHPWSHSFVPQESLLVEPFNPEYSTTTSTSTNDNA